MILHPGDMYIRGETQVHPGSLNFWKSTLRIGVSVTCPYFIFPRILEPFVQDGHHMIFRTKLFSLSTMYTVVSNRDKGIRSELK